MRAADDAGIPVPLVLDILNEQGPEPPILLMTHGPGVPLDTIAAGLSDDALLSVASAAGRALGMIHSLDVGSGYGNLDEDLRGSAGSLEAWFINDFQLVIARVAEALLADDAAVAWLHRAATYVADSRDLLVRDEACCCTAITVRAICCSTVRTSLR